MATEVGTYILNESNFLVGPNKAPLVGVADGAYLTIEPQGDEAGVKSGAKGDTMLFKRQNNAYTATINFLATGTGIGVLGQLRALGVAFEVFYKFGQSEFSGFALVQNRGTESLSGEGDDRPITLVIAKTTDVLAPQGEIRATNNN